MVRIRMRGHRSLVLIGVRVVMALDKNANLFLLIWSAVHQLPMQIACSNLQSFRANRDAAHSVETYT